MRRITVFSLAVVALTGWSVSADDGTKAPTPPTFASPADACVPAPNHGPVILQLGPPPNLYSPAADFKARLNSGAFAVLADGNSSIAESSAPASSPAAGSCPIGACQLPSLPTIATPGFLASGFSAPGFSTPAFATPEVASALFGLPAPSALPMPVYTAACETDACKCGSNTCACETNDCACGLNDGACGTNGCDCGTSNFAGACACGPSNPATCVWPPVSPMPSTSTYYYPTPHAYAATARLAFPTYVPAYQPAIQPTIQPMPFASAPPMYYPPYPPTPAGYSSAAASTSPATGEADRLEHMLEAVHHLEAAGLQAEADQLRRRCDGEMRAVAEQLKSAQAALAQLQHLTGNDKMVAVRVQLLELDRAKCKQLGIKCEWVGDDRKIHHSNIIENGRVDADGFLVALEALKKQGLVKVLSAPAIMTRGGQTATVSIGQETPSLTPQGDDTEAIQFQFIGTHLEIKPVVVGSDKVRLQIHCMVTQPTDACPNPTETQCPVAVTKHEIQTTLEVPSGKSAVVSGLVNHCDDSLVQRRLMNESLPTCDSIIRSALKSISGQSKMEPADTELLVVVQPEIATPGSIAEKPFNSDVSTIGEHGRGAQPLPSKLTWRPVRASAAATGQTNPFEDEESSTTEKSSTNVEPSGYFTQEPAEQNHSTIGTAGDDSTQCLNLPGIQFPKTCEPFSSGMEIHFEPAVTAQPYEIDPATFKMGSSWSGPMNFGGVGIGR